MNIVLSLLLVNAALGAFDTLWYHEYRARLTAKVEHTRPELQLHAARDAVYVVLYGGLAWWTPSGIFVAIVAALLTTEIVITLADFVVEDRDRPLIGGISPGERVLHSLMAIVYGVMLAHLVPVLLDAAGEPSAFVRLDTHLALSIGTTLAAVGIAISGARDAFALAGIDPIWNALRSVPLPNASPPPSVPSTVVGDARAMTSAPVGPTLSSRVPSVPIVSHPDTNMSESNLAGGTRLQT